MDPVGDYYEWESSPFTNTFTTDSYFCSTTKTYPAGEKVYATYFDHYLSDYF